MRASKRITKKKTPQVLYTLGIQKIVTLHFTLYILISIQIGVGSSNKKPKNLILYIHGLSAPSRAVWMTAKAANIPVTIRYLDLFKGEHKTPEFAKVLKITQRSAFRKSN